MSYDKFRNDLDAKRQWATSMGGPERIARQYSLGKLTARERIALLFDSDTFREYGQLSPSIDGLESTSTIEPCDGVITGFGLVDGRHVAVVAEDFTVRGGSLGRLGVRKHLRMLELVGREKVPLVWLLDGAGARADEWIGEGLPKISHFYDIARLSGVVPQVAAVMGPCAGNSATVAALSEFIVMVEGTGMIAAAGPPVVRAATGEVVTKEELGGTAVHCDVSGVADNPAKSDHEAIDTVRKYLSYFPTNAFSYPPRTDADNISHVSTTKLEEIVPTNLRRAYDIRLVIDQLADRESFFEVKPRFAPMAITGLARINGHAVGVIANQPTVNAGALTAASAQKIRRFIDLCTSYHLPLIFLVDVPGVMPGRASEAEGALRAGLSVAYALAWSTAPKITVVLRKAYGLGGSIMCGSGGGQTVTLAWPTADFGSLPPEAGVSVAFAKELEETDNPEEARAELISRFTQFSGAYAAVSEMTVDDVIEPAETRTRLMEALDLAESRKSIPAKPSLRGGVMP